MWFKSQDYFSNGLTDVYHGVAESWYKQVLRGDFAPPTVLPTARLALKNRDLPVDIDVGEDDAPMDDAIEDDIEPPVVDDEFGEWAFQADLERIMEGIEDEHIEEPVEEVMQTV